MNEKEEVSPLDSVGKAFNFDGSAYAETRDQGSAFTVSTINDPDILGQARVRVSDLLKGVLPEDVNRSVRTATAQRAVAGGFSGSPMARNLTARDLGLTSLDLVTKGIEGATQIGSLDIQRQVSEGDQQIRAAALREEVRKSNDAFALAMRESDQSTIQLALAGLELRSNIRQFELQMENQLLIADSQNAIPNLQENLDSQASAFDGLSKQIQEILNTIRGPNG